jgi:hypothetical protein
MLATGELLAAGQDLLGGGEVTKLVQRFAQQQRPGSIQVPVARRSR